MSFLLNLGQQLSCSSWTSQHQGLITALDSWMFRVITNFHSQRKYLAWSSVSLFPFIKSWPIPLSSLLYVHFLFPIVSPLSSLPITANPPLNEPCPLMTETLEGTKQSNKQQDIKVTYSTDFWLTDDTFA